MATVTNNYTSTIALPDGQEIPAGASAEIENFADFKDHAVVKTWVKGEVISVSGADPDKATAKAEAAAAKAKADQDTKDAADKAKTDAQVDTAKAAAAATPGQPQTLEAAGTKQDAAK